MSSQLSSADSASSAPRTFDRRKLEALCAERKKDYADLDIFAFQRDGFLAKKHGKRMSAVELPRRNPRHRSSSRSSVYSRRSTGTRSATLRARQRPRPRTSQSADARGGYVSSGSFASSKVADPDLFVIGSKTPKRRSKHSIRIDTGSTENSASSLQTIKSNRRSFMKSNANSQRISVGEKFDPDLLETTDDEEYIFHAPYPLGGTIVVNNMSFAESWEPSRERHHQLSDPGRFSYLRRTTQPSHTSHPPSYRNCRRSVLRWVANKLCRSPSVKHQ